MQGLAVFTNVPDNCNNIVCHCITGVIQYYSKSVTVIPKGFLNGFTLLKAIDLIGKESNHCLF